jgi:hypothetical protein
MVREGKGRMENLIKRKERVRKGLMRKGGVEKSKGGRSTRKKKRGLDGKLM